LASALAVLVREQLEAESLDRALPSLALRDPDDVDLLTCLVDVI
jgi:hypothetical protein